MNLLRNRDKPFQNQRKKVLLNKMKLIIRMMWNMNMMKKNIILKMKINEI